MRYHRLTVVLAFVLCIAACSEPRPEQAAVLIRSGDQTITLAQFERAFTTARIAYGDDRSVDRELIQQARLRFLHQLGEELVVARRAADLDIAIDDTALTAAVDAIKADYPEGEFEQMLLESAIPFPLWKERLRARLLVEKVAKVDLIDAMVVTTQEIETYYRNNADAFQVDEQKTVPDALKHRIIDQLRREKVEAAWPAWIENLKTRYGIDINWPLWEQAKETDEAANRRKEEDGS